MSKETGGPAFPQVAVDEDDFLYEPGMTLRDYFAAKAMIVKMQHGGFDETIAQEAYEMADAMLAERNK